MVSVPPNHFLPQISLILLCCVSLHCAAVGPWGYLTLLKFLDASISPGDCQMGEGKCNKTKIQLEFNSKGKEQKSNCSLGTPLLEGFLKCVLTDTTNYLQKNKCTVEKLR